MPRPRAKTAARGYSGQHATLRQTRLAAYQPGDVCAVGGEPLPYPLPAVIRDKHGTRLVSPYLDLPHNDARTGYLPGLACRKHNRGEGNRSPRRRARQYAAAWVTSRIW